MALVCRSFGRVKVLFAALTIVLTGLQLSIIAAAASFVDGGDFERLAQVVPTFVLQTLGPALTSFGGMVLFAYFDPLIVMLLVQFAIYLATEPAGEIESNLVDLILARPLPRHWLVSRSLLVMTIGTAVMSGAMYTTTWLGLWWLAPADAQWPDPSTAISLATHLTLTAWCFGSAALAASAWARRRGAAVGAIAVTAIAAYLIELLEAIWAPAQDLALFSPVSLFPRSSHRHRHGRHGAESRCARNHHPGRHRARLLAVQQTGPLSGWCPIRRNCDPRDHRALSHHVQARRRRHGRGLSRDRHQARSRGRDQSCPEDFARTPTAWRASRARRRCWRR